MTGAGVIGRWLIAALAAMALAAPAHAQDPARVTRVQNALDGWLVQHGAAGSVAITFEGALVTTHDAGLDPDMPVELASLGKSITAICTYVLFQEGALNYTDTPVSVLGRGPAVSVAQLLTHSGGFVDDITQTAMSNWLDTPGHRAADVAVQLGDPTGPRNVFAYNNANYALLALVIEGVTSEPYEQACRTRVLAPVGVTATPSPRTGAFLSWGGWQMTVADYARFHAHWYGTAALSGTDPFSHPHAPVADSVFYGLGTLFRPFRQRYNFWHHGALCFGEDMSAGAFAVTWEAEWTVVVAYDRCVPWEAMSALDQALVAAIFGEGP